MIRFAFDAYPAIPTGPSTDAPTGLALSDSKPRRVSATACPWGIWLRETPRAYHKAARDRVLCHGELLINTLVLGLQGSKSGDLEMHKGACVVA